MSDWPEILPPEVAERLSLALRDDWTKLRGEFLVEIERENPLSHDCPGGTVCFHAMRFANELIARAKAMFMAALQRERPQIRDANDLEQTAHAIKVFCADLARAWQDEAKNWLIFRNIEPDSERIGFIQGDIAANSFIREFRLWDREHCPRTALAGTEPNREEWSPPMTRTEMARRITRQNDVRLRKVEPLLSRYQIENVRGRLYRVRLDLMDRATRKRFESVG